MLKGILLSLLLTAAWIGAHIVIFRLRRPVKMFRTLLLLFALTVPLFPLVYMATPPDLGFLSARVSETSFPLGLLNGMFIHCFLFVTYAEFFYYVTRAVTLRILIEIFKRGNATLSDIQREYSVDTMVHDRLDAMGHNGFVLRHGERFLVTAWGAWCARLFASGRRFCKVPE